MHLPIVFLCFVFAVIASNAQRPSNGRQQGEALSRRCQSQEHVTEADLQQLSMQRKPSTKTAKCFHACMMESIGMIVEGKLSIDNSVKIIGEMEKNREFLKVIEVVSTECSNIDEVDRCEMAFKVMMCTDEGMRKREGELRRFMPRQRPQEQ